MIKILLVEDSENIRQLYSEKLKMNQFVVSLAADGEEGLRKALTEKPNLILLDLAMPKMDGFTVMKKLRLDTWGKNVPIIILTNTPSEANGTLKGITENQPAFYLIKSQITPADVLEKVKEVLIM